MIPELPDLRAAIESVFRQDSGRILASLIRICGSFTDAEEALQESFASALASWPAKGIPHNPAAWIMTAARHRLIDAARRDRTRLEKQDALLRQVETGSTHGNEAIEDSLDFPDDRLRLIFTCCHPAIHLEAQLALTLRTLGGLTTPEIAKAFLVPEATLAQRLVRAKRKIQESRIPYEVPARERLAERLVAVQAVVYLIFNEGYTSSSGAGLVRNDLCIEAIRLGRMLCELLPQEAENIGLLALMVLQHSRRDARVANGQLVTLEEQDRSLWDHAAISEGLNLIAEVQALGRAGPYQLQAAIGAVHARATTPEETDWRQIEEIYLKLLEINASPVIALNHAAAVAMAGDLEGGLDSIEELGRGGRLDQYYLFHAARADLLRRLERYRDAAEAYHRAAALTTNRLEADYLNRRLARLPPDTVSSALGS
jgi:RNA polymerase sigma-70 factor (ECF subfamily)